MLLRARLRRVLSLGLCSGQLTKILPNPSQQRSVAQHEHSTGTGLDRALPGLRENLNGKRAATNMCRWGDRAEPRRGWLHRAHAIEASRQYLPRGI